MSEPSNQKRQITPGFLAEVVRQLRLAWRLLLDSRVPLWVKAIVPALLIYVISPIDLVPDAILGLGQLDDPAVLIFGIKLFVELCPPAVVREHMQRLLGESGWRIEPDTPPSSSSTQVIDAPYEVKRDE